MDQRSGWPPLRHHLRAADHRQRQRHTIADPGRQRWVCLRDQSANRRTGVEDRDQQTRLEHRRCRSQQPRDPYP